MAAFEDHLDACQQCANNPFSLCLTGELLLKQAATEAAQAMAPAAKKSRFQLGEIVGTPAALTLLQHHRITGAELLSRHQSGDWGNIGSFERQANEEALLSGDRIVSRYTLPDTNQVLVITEMDRSVTTILLSSEY